jgi:hypothetical protein
MVEIVGIWPGGARTALALLPVIASEAKQSSLSAMLRFGFARRTRETRGFVIQLGAWPQRWIA